MTQTLTTEAMQEIYEAAVHVEATGDDQDACFELLCKLEDVGGTGATIRKLIDIARAVNLEAQPFMHAICNSDGSAWLDENCVAGTAEELKPVLNDLRRDTGDGFRIVPLFTAPPAPANVKPVCLLTIGAKTLADHSVAWTAAGMQLGKGIHRLYAVPQSPAYPERLPCPVHLLPGLKFGQGIPTKTLLEALARRTEYNAQMEAMTPEERADHDARVEAFKASLPLPAPEEPEPLK